MSDYLLIDSEGHVMRASDRACIPPDPANADRVAYVAWLEAGGVPDPVQAAPGAAATITPQDLLAQFTPNDIAAVQSAIAPSPENALLWYSLLAQRDPMHVNNARFLAGWNQLRQILGGVRMIEIATALGVEVGPG